jgi:hypothetical protein
MELAHVMGATLAVFEKEDPQFQTVSLLCPSFVPYDAMHAAGSEDVSLVMLLKEEDAYQPLEYKESGKAGVARVPLRAWPKIRRALAVCASEGRSDADWQRKWAHFIDWLDGGLISAPGDYRLKTTVLAPDHHVSAFVTFNGLWLPVDLSAGALRNVPTPRVSFHEDLVGTQWRPRIIARDWAAVSAKWRALGIAHALPTTEGGLFLPPLPNHAILPLVPQRDDDVLVAYERLAATKRRQWARMEVYVGSQLFAHYDAWVAPIRAQTRAERADALLPKFAHLHRDRIVQVILQEVPLHDRHALGAWLRRRRFELPDHRVVHVTRREIVFDQTALPLAQKWLDITLAPKSAGENQTLDPAPMHASPTPSSAANTPETQEQDLWAPDQHTIEHLPVFPQRRLPSCRVWTPKQHSADLFQRWVLRAARLVTGTADLPVLGAEIRSTERDTLLRLLMSKDALMEALDTTTIFHAMATAIGAPAAAGGWTNRELADRAFIEARKEGPVALAERVHAALEDAPTELTLDALARVTGMVVWVFYKNKKRLAAPPKRGTFEEVLSMSNVFMYGPRPWTVRPMLCLYKDVRLPTFELLAVAGRPFWLRAADMPPDVHEVFGRWALKQPEIQK